ncbi:MAG: hypothetical protein IT378_09085 [Sandaracinaceae bacterium]|nr:hypothetical protein [Sandaracinaceae bacterium]
MNCLRRRALQLAFTLAALAPAVAHADRVLLYPVGGRADEDRLETVEQSLATILREQGHTLVPPSDRRAPASSQAMEQVAAAAQAVYVVTADIEPMPGQYRLHVLVYYRPAGRLEELLVGVLLVDEQSRLRDVLRSMVRPEGLGDDAVRLTGIEETAEQRAAREAAERARLEGEERARREAEERARAEEEARRRADEEAARQREDEERRAREAREREEREGRARNAWNDRVRYGTDGPWLLQLGAGGRYIGAFAGQGGGLFDVTARVGRTFDGVDGFELRGGLDVTTGAVTGIAIHAGAAYLGSVFVEPIYLGVAGEIGVFFALTGARNVAFSARIGPVLAWRPLPHLYFEVSAPELGLLTAGSGALGIGGSLRVGYRF